MTTDTLPEVLEFKNRQIIDLSEPPPEMSGMRIRHFGVALNHDEAQRLIEMGLRVFGDESGPYLVVRIRASQYWPFVINTDNVDVTVEPIRWSLRHTQGIICWLKHIV